MLKQRKEEPQRSKLANSWTLELRCLGCYCQQAWDTKLSRLRSKLLAALADRALWPGAPSGVMLPQPMIPRNGHRPQKTLQVVCLSSRQSPGSMAGLLLQNLKEKT